MCVQAVHVNSLAECDNVAGRRPLQPGSRGRKRAFGDHRAPLRYPVHKRAAPLGCLDSWLEKCLAPSPTPRRPALAIASGPDGAIDGRQCLPEPLHRSGRA
ncbi:hypothetical protein V6O07_08815, partial [Arthrospira platensis SPKY2]